MHSLYYEFDLETTNFTLFSHSVHHLFTERCDVSDAMNKKTSEIICKFGGPAISIVSYGIIVGFALGGLAMMCVSALAWVIFDASWFGGLSFLTGGIFFCTAMALALGKLAKAGDRLYRDSRKLQVAS